MDIRPGKGWISEMSGFSSKAEQTVSVVFPAAPTPRSHSRRNPLPLPPHAAPHLNMATLVWGWGWSGFGQSGTSSTGEQHSPAPLVFSSQPAGTGAHGSAAGYVPTRRAAPAGESSSGSAEGPAHSTDPPVRIVSLAASAFHSAAVDSAGDVWTWGNGRQGQLGHGGGGTQNSRSRADASEGDEEVKPRLVTTKATGANDFVTIACGASHTMAVTTDGLLFATGQNSHGQLGIEE